MILRQATLAEVASLDRASHPHWGGGLPVDLHCAREERLRAGTWPRQAREAWAWENGAGCVATCETYRVNVAVGGASRRAWEIASVFTDPAHRGRGHASAMLGALAERVRAEPDAAALLLFSDVDPRIYARLGFVARPAFDRVLPARADAPRDPRVEAVAEAALPLLPPSRPRAGSFGLAPTAEMLDWQIDHARICADLVGAAHAPWCGARLGTESIVWTAADDHLLVLLLDADAHAGALIDEAARAAAALGLPTVRAWETPAWPTALGAREPRQGGLPMLMPLAPEVDAEEWLDIPRGVWV